MWELDYNENWVLKNWWFWTMVLDRLLRIPWIARSNYSILKEIGTEYPLKGLILKLNHQHIGHLMWRIYSLEKSLMLGNIEGRRRSGWQRMRCWIASLIQWTRVWASSRGWWCTGKPGMLQSMGLQSQTWLCDWIELNRCPLQHYS